MGTSDIVQNKFGGLRWFLGLLCVVGIMAFLFSLSAYRLTDESVAKSVIAKSLDIVFRQEGMKELTPAVNYINELSKHQKELQGLSQLQNIDPTKMEGDLTSMPPEQAEKYLQDTLAGPLYDSSQILDSLKKVDPSKKIEAADLNVINLANTTSHSNLKKALYWQGGILFVLLLAFALLNIGVKKISNPGIIIIIASLPGLLLLLFLNQILAAFVAPAISKYLNTPLYDAFINEIIDPTAKILLNIFLIPALIGIGLVILAIIINLVVKLSGKTKKIQPSTSQVN